MRHNQYRAKKLQEASAKYAADITVFLAGPYIKPKEPAPDGDGITNAHRARYFLFHKIFDQKNITSSLGEHQDLLDIGAEAFGNLANAHNSELLVAKKYSDAVIILPSSPGSFCEIGLFAEHSAICEKMLIIVDEQFREAKSYFSLGPLAEAESKKSRVEYCKYDDTEQMWAIVQNFLSYMTSIKMLKELRSS